MAGEGNYRGGSGPLGDTHKFGRGSEHAAWIHEQIELANQKLRFVAGAVVDNLKPGLVLVSNSGNFRLIIDVVPQSSSDAHITFLSQLVNGEVRVEHASLRKIDLHKIRGVVFRRQENPIGKIIDVVSNMDQEHAVVSNVSILLGMGALGTELRSEMERARENNKVTTVPAFVDSSMGEILAFGEHGDRSHSRHVDISFNLSGSPADDYIRSATFFEGTETVVRRNIVAASILANTIQNARNLVHFIDLDQAET